MTALELGFTLAVFAVGFGTGWLCRYVGEAP
jgi:hypothetical protein